MFEFFDQVINFFDTIFTLIENLVNSLFMLVKTLGTVITLPGTLLPFLPVVIATAVSVTIALGIVKMVVGR